MSEWVTTTEQVRDAYDLGVAFYKGVGGPNGQQAEGGFDRWLADHDRRVTEEMLGNVTRVTVVSEAGVEYEDYHVYESGCFISVQDEGRTLKILPAQFKEDGNE